VKIKVTQAKVRKSIFDVLGEAVREKVAIDVFAGTGTLGIEALRRGAKKVIFVEKDKRLAFAIRNALHRELGQSSVCEGRADIWAVDAFKALPVLKRRGFFFDIFFADPPYNFRDTAGFLERFFSSGVLKKEAKGVVEHTRHLQLPEYPEFKKWKERKFGGTVLTFYCGSKN
jgi:16S rRNA (guanine(966)-N(2))-methyltransferase RsmD